MITLNPFNTLAIGQCTQTLNNDLNCHYGKINVIQKVKSFFLVGNNSIFQSKEPISVKVQTETSVKVRTKYVPETVFLVRTNVIFRHVKSYLKSRFCESIKRGKQIPPISSIKLTDYFLFDLASFSRQVEITQAEKLVFSFLACSSICSIKSWGKRIAFLSDLLFLLPVAIFIPKRCLLVCRHYTRSLNNKKDLTCAHTVKYSEHTPNKFIRLKKQSPEVLATLSRDLTTITLTEVMIMANRYDNARLRAKQSKIYKFYDLSTAQVIETIATTECQARKSLGKSSLIFISVICLHPVIDQARSFGGYGHE
jgi:hypothetical protein